MRRWTITIKSMDGVVQHEAQFRTRRKAVAYGASMRSFMYDVWLDSAGRQSALLHAHTPPQVWAADQLGA